MLKNKLFRAGTRRRPSSRDLLVILALLTVLGLGGAAVRAVREPPLRLQGDAANRSGPSTGSSAGNAPLLGPSARSDALALQPYAPVPGWAVPRAGRPGGPLVSQAISYDTSPHLPAPARHPARETDRRQYWRKR